MNLAYLITRFIFCFVSDYYYLSMVILAIGSGFYPTGIRVGYTLGKPFFTVKGPNLN